MQAITLAKLIIVEALEDLQLVVNSQIITGVVELITNRHLLIISPQEQAPIIIINTAQERNTVPKMKITIITNITMLEQ
jgi:hypothetical protein